VYVVVVGGVVVVVDEGAGDDWIVGDVVGGAILQAAPNRDPLATAIAKVHPRPDFANAVVVRARAPMARPFFFWVNHPPRFHAADRGIRHLRVSAGA